MRYPLALALLVGSSVLAPTASANETIVLEGEVPEGGPDHFRLPFEVPEGTREIEVRHDDLSEANILDWGLDDPAGFRGWGGGNTEPAVVSEKAASRSYLIGPMKAGTWQVVVGKAKIVEKPARYRVEIELRTETTLPEQPERRPYVPVPALKKEARYYAGDFHVHSRESGDAKPTMVEVIELSKKVGLDFVELSEHNTTSHLDFFGELQAKNPDLLLVPGVEYTTYAGHANGIGATEFVDHKIGQPGVTIEGAIQAFREQGALFSLNHPKLELGDLCIGCAFKHDIPGGSIDAIEIGTGGFKQGGMMFTPMVVSMWEELSAEGHRIAPIGGSDDHEAGQGRSPIGSPTTLVFADELSVEGILEGIRKGRTVVKLQAPDDPMIELEAGGELPGGTVEGRRIALRATVQGGAGQQLRLVESGEPRDPVEITSDPFVYETTIEPPSSGESFVRAEVLVGDHPRTITNHIWLRRGGEGEDERGGGCHVGSSKGKPVGFAAALLGLLLVARRRRGQKT